MTSTLAAPVARVTATVTDRLTAIHALACVTKLVSFENHAGIIARLLNGEDYETVEHAFMHLETDDAVGALERICIFYERQVDLHECGASQDRDSGMWENTGSFEAACDDAREIAAMAFITLVRDGLVKDLHELTPARQAVIRARAIAMEVNAQVVS